MQLQGNYKAYNSSKTNQKIPKKFCTNWTINRWSKKVIDF